MLARHAVESARNEEQKRNIAEISQKVLNKSLKPGSKTMLIEFSVANFRSVKDRQTLSLVASSGTEHKDQNVIGTDADAISLLRSAVIYGPNAAGKSNLFRAILTLQQLVRMSGPGMQEGQPLDVSPFLLTEESANKPSEFEIVFVANDKVRYHYFCSLDRERVWKEWMVAYPLGRPQRWFEREYRAERQAYSWWFGPNFKGEKAEQKVWQEFTRSNALFFSTAIQLNNDQLRPAFSWIAQHLIVLTAGIDWNPGLSLELLKDATGQERILEFMHAADIDIDRIEIVEQDMTEKGDVRHLPAKSGSLRIRLEVVGGAPGSPPVAPKMVRVRTWHSRTDGGSPVAMDLLGDESDGTKKLFEFMGGWLRAFELGATLFVDELDRSLHPLLTRFLVRQFHRSSGTNDAQLVFTTHDTTLLDADLLRRDQVWFVERHRDEKSTQLYSLLEYRPRKEEALERGYLIGRYGALPFVGELRI